MGFMQPQIYEADYLEIDGPMGGEIIPCDIADLSFEILQAMIAPSAIESVNPHQTAEYYGITFKPAIEVPAAIRDYCENEKIWSIDRKRGFLARMSAPGYMDCTSWSAHDSEEEAREHLAEMYGDDDD